MFYHLINFGIFPKIGSLHSATNSQTYKIRGVSKGTNYTSIEEMNLINFITVYKRHEYSKCIMFDVDIIFIILT